MKTNYGRYRDKQRERAKADLQNLGVFCWLAYTNIFHSGQYDKNGLVLDFGLNVTDVFGWDAIIVSDGN